MLRTATSPLPANVRTWSCALPIPPHRAAAGAAGYRTASPTSPTAIADRASSSRARLASAGRTSSDPRPFNLPAHLRALHTTSTPAQLSSRILLDANFFSSSRQPFSTTAGASSSSASVPPVDISSYAPTTDDPTSSVLGSRGSRVPISQPPIPKSSSEALALGYRPVVPPFSSSRQIIKVYRSLSKSQLTFLIVLTSMAPYALVPSALATSASVVTLLSLTAGTALCSSAANAINEMVESPYDAQMPRTRNRPLPARQLTPLHAASFAVATSTTGLTLLYTLVNPTVAALGGLNIILYSFCYTPLKRLHIVNTWLGAVVGALPPLMGWAAATGTLFETTDTPAWVLASILFAWQFPHFNSLAHNLRSEYARGGYRMMSVSHPALNRRTSLRYALTLIPLCSVALPLTGVVVPLYALLSLTPNLILVETAFNFYLERGLGGESAARKAFFASLLHLPTVLLLAMVCKTGFWLVEDDDDGAETKDGSKTERSSENKTRKWRWNLTILGFPYEDIGPINRSRILT